MSPEERLTKALSGQTVTAVAWEGEYRPGFPPNTMSLTLTFSGTVLEVRATEQGTIRVIVSRQVLEPVLQL